MQLTKIETKILNVLSENADYTSRKELNAKVYGQELRSYASLDVHLFNMKKKGVKIENKHKVGYKVVND
jgi:DNA-binding response OmpR family regulator